MKNIILTMGISILLVACSSGSAVVELPANVTNRYQGNFVNTPGSQRGTVTLDLVDDNAGGVTGNIIFQSNGANCLRNNTVTGTTTGFNVSLEVAQESDEFTTVETITEETVTETTTTATGAVVISPATIVPVSTITTVSSTGTTGTTETRVEISNTLDTSPADTDIRTIVTRVTNISTTATGLTSTLTIQLTSSNGGNTLAGTYTSSSGICSNQTGSGTMTLNR